MLLADRQQLKRIGELFRKAQARRGHVREGDRGIGCPWSRRREVQGQQLRFPSHQGLQSVRDRRLMLRSRPCSRCGLERHLPGAKHGGWPDGQFNNRCCRGRNDGNRSGGPVLELRSWSYGPAAGNDGRRYAPGDTKVLVGSRGKLCGGGLIRPGGTGAGVQPQGSRRCYECSPRASSGRWCASCTSASGQKAAVSIGRWSERTDVGLAEGLCENASTPW